MRPATLGRATAACVGVALLTLSATGAVEPRSVPPLPGATRVAVIGDFGTASPSERAIASALRASANRHGLSALVTTGDNIYPNGEPENYQDAWHEPYGWIEERGVQVVGALGNHDVRGGHASSVMQLLQMPGRWYTRVIGVLELVVLDSNALHDDTQRQFLADAMAAEKPVGAAFRVVVFHHPPFSCSLHGGDGEVVDRWLPLFEEGDVDLVLSGHEHVYQRFSLDDGDAYVVTGGGGAPLHGMRECAAGSPAPEAFAVRHHYVLIEATPTTLRLQSLTAGGGLLDVTSLRSRAGAEQ